MNSYLKSVAFRLLPVLLTAALSCGGASPPAAPPAPLAGATPRFDLFGGVRHGDSVSLAAREHIWEAILGVYAARQTGGEADILSRVGRDFGHDEGPVHRGPSSLVLLSARDTALRPYPSEWLSTLTQRGLIREVCSAHTLAECPDTVITTFLTLGDPVHLGGDSVSVSVDESAVNPADCRRTETLGGSEMWDMLLVGRDTSWAVVPGHAGMMIGSTWSCGNPPPAEQARRS